MAKVGRPIKFLIRLTSEKRTRLEGMIHCGKRRDKFGFESADIAQS